jgi:hypothetical protein
MRILSQIQRCMGRPMMIITVPMLECAIAAILLMSASVVAFTYYLSPISAYSQKEPFPSNPLYKSVV